MRQTPHNLAAPGRAADLNSGEVCVFCHTPIADPEGSGGAVVPKWQRSLGPGYSFALGDNTGSHGQPIDDVIGSQSVVCLSCHDANQAVSVSRTSDHPFAVPYRGMKNISGSADWALARIGTFPVPDVSLLKFRDSFRAPVKSMVDERTVWWVPTGDDRTKRARSDLPLYTRSMSGGEETAFIECGTCHDPHIERKQFLRTTNEGSRLCLSCHDT